MSTVESDSLAARRDPKHKRLHLDGGVVEAAFGAVAMFLSICALMGAYVMPLTGLAVIAAGAALMLDGAATAAGEALTHPTGASDRLDGFGVESLAGIGAITLGILALIGIAPLTLLPVAVIVLGAGLLLATGVSVRTHGAPLAAWSIYTLIGAGAIVLGILGLVHDAPNLLTLIAVLAVGAGLALSGTNVGGRMVAMFNRGT